MTQKEIQYLLQDQSNFYGTYYELSIQINKSYSLGRGSSLVAAVFQLLRLNGPFGDKGNTVTFSNAGEQWHVHSVVDIQGTLLPITVWFIQAKGSDAWIDICFSSGSIEKAKTSSHIHLMPILQTWLKEQCLTLLKAIPIEIAMIGEECGGMFSIQDILHDHSVVKSHTEYVFFIPEDKRNEINVESENVNWYKRLQ